jgi:hypothetical protein
MINIFIQYGDDEGKEVGLRLRAYLLDKRLNPFLAGDGSQDIPAGTPDYWTYIRQRIILSDVLVSVCNDGFENSSGVQREFKFIKKEKRDDLPRIPFIKRGCSIPKYYVKSWHPLYFEINSYEDKFCELLNEIYRWAYFKNIEAVAQLGHRLRIDSRSVPII